MAKRNEFLSKKERKMFSRLIAEKLSSLGMQDEVIFIQFKGPGGKPAVRKYVNELGHTMFESPIGKLSNPFRSLVKRLRKMPRSVVQEFLAAQVGKKEDPKDGTTPATV